MKANERNISRHSCGGFTLLEMTVAVAVSLMVATGALMLLTQHTSFLRTINDFRFLREEAPQVNRLVTQLVGRSISYRIYGAAGDAFSNTGAVNSGGKAVRLIFRNPSGLVEESVIAFESSGDEGRLNYYRRNGLWPPSPDWVISSRVADVDFSDSSGVLLMTLTGPAAEEITYAGTIQ